MQALVDFVVRNLLALWPVARIYSWQHGLLLRGGIIRRTLGPGLHWRWWFLEEVKNWPANDMAVDLETAAVTTADGKAVAISANLTYRCVDVAAFYREVWNTETTLQRVALGEIATHCAREEWDYLRTQRVATETMLLAALNERVTRWGINVSRIHLTDLVLVRPYRHYLDGKDKPT